jgi:hypothetical protein
MILNLTNLISAIGEIIHQDWGTYQEISQKRFVTKLSCVHIKMFKWN